MDHISMIIKYEQGDLSFQQTLDLFSELIKSELVWKLQGHYGRTAVALIKNGYLSKNGDILKQE